MELNDFIIKECIKKDKHSSNHPSWTWFSNKLKVKCKFDKSCWYEDNHGNYGEIKDTHKLIGIGEINHQKNSIRIGWLPLNTINKDSIQIGTYEYNEDKRIFKWITNVKTDEWFTIHIINQKVFCYYNDKQYSETFDCKFKSVKLLNFYFGGNDKTPHEMCVTKIYEK